jgi:hypothetical protein
MERLKRIRKRHGRCYELAGLAMLYERGSEEFVLAHGKVNFADGPDGRMAHAWIILPDGRVYDPVLNKYYASQDEYRLRHGAVVEVSYTHKEFCAAMVKAKHSGPWH